MRDDFKTAASIYKCSLSFIIVVDMELHCYIILAAQGKLTWILISSNDHKQAIMTSIHCKNDGNAIGYRKIGLVHEYMATCRTKHGVADYSIFRTTSLTNKRSYFTLESIHTHPIYTHACIAYSWKQHHLTNWAL